MNKAWLNEHLTDTYGCEAGAQKDGYRARAAYKLKEIDEAFQLIRPGQVVVDLGAVHRRLGASTCAASFAPKVAGVGVVPPSGELDGTIIALDILPARGD